jgi:hypothetical protein
VLLPTVVSECLVRAAAPRNHFLVSRLRRVVPEFGDSEGATNLGTTLTVWKASPVAVSPVWRALATRQEAARECTARALVRALKVCAASVGWGMIPGQQTRAGFGQGGLGSAYGVEGRGSGSLAGVGGFGAGGPLDPGPVSPAGVFGQGGDGNAHGVEGRASGRFAGVAGFGEAAPSTPPVSAAGVYGQAGLGNNNGVEGRGSGNFAGVAGFGDVSPSATGGIGVFAVGGAPAPASGQPGGPGVYAVGFGGPGYTPLNKTAGVYGIGGASNGPGVLGQGGSADGVQGSSGSGNGVSGQSGTGVGVRASSGTATGLVAEGATGLIAGTLLPNGTAGQFDGNVVVSGHLTVGGAKSVAVPLNQERLCDPTLGPEIRSYRRSRSAMPTGPRKLLDPDGATSSSPAVTSSKPTPSASPTSTCDPVGLNKTGLQNSPIAATDLRKTSDSLAAWPPWVASRDYRVNAHHNPVIQQHIISKMAITGL